jgi:hypothetical protein
MLGRGLLPELLEHAPSGAGFIFSYQRDWLDAAGTGIVRTGRLPLSEGSAANCLLAPRSRELLDDTLPALAELVCEPRPT